MSGDGCCCHDLERERIGASELEDAYAEAMGALNRATAQRDAARDIAARLEGELARVREIVTAWSLGETSRDEMVLWAIRDIVGLTPAKPDNPTPWPHPDAVIAEGES